MSKEEIQVEILEMKEVWVAWVNTDLTEGRGFNIPLCVCLSETTARRLGVGKNVQGGDATVRKDLAVRVQTTGSKQWLASCNLEYPSECDKKEDSLRAKRAEVRERAVAAGLTDEDLALLSTGG